MFDALLRQGRLPEQLVFPPGVHGQFGRLWRRSVREEREWGMTLCLDKAGDVHCRHACAGTANAFASDLPVRGGERLLGVYHTHVYGSGETGVAFSDFDIAMLVVSPGIPLSVAQSGGELFALVRTRHTVSVVPQDFFGGNGLFYDKVAEFQESDVALSYQEALWLANLDFGQQFGCALYAGRLFEPLKVVFRP